MSTVVDQSTLAGLRVFVGLQPKDMPKSMYVPLNFVASSGADIGIDLELQEEQHKLEFVQSVFIDNTLSGEKFILTALTSQQNLTILSGKQAYLPILAPPGCKFNGSIGGSPAGGIVKIQFNNFYVPPIVW